LPSAANKPFAALGISGRRSSLLEVSLHEQGQASSRETAQNTSFVRGEKKFVEYSLFLLR
jgi:hypothetical protein